MITHPISAIVNTPLTAREFTSRFVVIVLSMVSLPMLGAAQSAPTCPPISFPDTINLAKNPSFEYTGPYGSFTAYQGVFPNPAYSAAADWLARTEP